MICDKCTGIVPPFFESKMFPRKRRERERDRWRTENWRTSINRLFIRGQGRTRDSIFLEEIYPSGKGIRRVSTRQFAVLIEADAALMKRSNRVFRLKNGPLEMKSSVAEGCFLRSRHSINSLFFSSSFLFFQRVTLSSLSRGSRIPFFDYARFLNPFFDTFPISLQPFPDI